PLLVLTEFPPKLGGMQSHAHYLARHLAARGYEVEVFTYRTVDRRDRDGAPAFDALQFFPVGRVLSRVGHWRNVGHGTLARYQAMRWAADRWEGRVLGSRATHVLLTAAGRYAALDLRRMAPTGGRPGSPSAP